MAPGTIARQGAASQGSNRSNGLGRVTLKNKLTALVVDGNRICQILEKALLESYGVETQVVGNGRDAVALFSAGAVFNLIVIAMILPVMNGLEATRQIRAMGIRTKILGVTACSYERERQAFLDAGVDEFIEKPLTPERLIPILRELDNQ